MTINPPRFQNKKGEWVPSIPMPYMGLRNECSCGKKFWKMYNYEAHFALVHILRGEPTTPKEPTGTTILKV